MRDQRIGFWLVLYIVLVIFSVMGYAATAAFHLNAGKIGDYASLATLLAGFTAILFDVARSTGFRRALILTLGVAAIGLISELVGLRTHWPFGSYSYADTWWPTRRVSSIGNFPLLVPFAWTMVVLSAILSVFHVLQGWWAIIAAALIAAVVDLLMEWSLAVQMHYWTWASPEKPLGEIIPGVPLLNSVGWFAVACVCGVFARLVGAQDLRCERTSLAVLILHCVLVGSLGIVTFATTQGHPIR